MDASDSFGSALLINSPSVSVPQVIFILSIIAIFLILGKHQLVVIPAYLFYLHWTFVSQQVILAKHFGDSGRGKFMFVVLGFSLAVMGVLSFF